MKTEQPSLSLVRTDDLRQEILAEIRRTLSAELEVHGTVEPHHELASDLLVDSVGAIVLVVALEDRFRVKLTGVGASSVVSVEDLVGVVERAVHADRSAERADHPARDARGGGGRPAP